VPGPVALGYVHNDRDYEPPPNEARYARNRSHRAMRARHPANDPYGRPPAAPAIAARSPPASEPSFEAALCVHVASTRDPVVAHPSPSERDHFPRGSPPCLLQHQRDPLQERGGRRSDGPRMAPKRKTRGGRCALTARVHSVARARNRTYLPGESSRISRGGYPSSDWSRSARDKRATRGPRSERQMIAPVRGADGSTRSRSSPRLSAPVPGGRLRAAYDGQEGRAPAQSHPPVNARDAPDLRGAGGSAASGFV
jgi:hypothetical protein